jgi:hypothetical protein
MLIRSFDGNKPHATLYPSDDAHPGQNQGPVSRSIGDHGTCNRRNVRAGCNIQDMRTVCPQLRSHLFRE